MEIDEDIGHSNESSKKHSVKKPRKTVESRENTKKARLFSAKEFRKKLHQDNDRVTALKQFLDAISESNGHDYVFEYLESGGNCLELLQTLEIDSSLSPVLIFELVAYILLKITASAYQYHSAAYEACRYMLNNYITILNKMISLSSNTQERKVCLKLLTAMITFSSTLAKDVLLQVNFHSVNVELLTKNTGEKKSVRDHFIHFLTAFLVDGSYPSLSVLLEKKGFITSIIKGLQFDIADTVCVVISAMKNYILENNLVSKTTKMKVFNTLVVRDIVNLYNWKGPAALKTERKNKGAPIAVDEYSKSKVSECVHDFLMVLCTSHRHGVIFKDHSLGLAKKHQNALMYTVLESLERPWEHSYASELVIKICAACPDLVKTVWTNLKSSLEPRLTQKWLNALKFARNLLKELQPNCIEFCAKELSISQLAQIIQILVAPLPILKAVIPENYIFINPIVKRYTMSLLLEILSCVNSYLDASVDWLNTEDHEKLKTFIANYITKNFPDAKAVLNDWEVEDMDCDTEENAIISDEAFLEIIFDVFDLYSRLVPQLLDSLSSMSFELTDLLVKLSNRCTDGKVSARLQVKTINIFIDLDPSNFSTNTELFSFVVPLLLKFYYETTDTNALAVLNKLLRYTGVFEGCLQEVNIWINGVLNLRHFDEFVAQSMVQILKISTENIMEFSDELSLLNTGNNTDKNILEIIEKLKNADLTFEDEGVIIKHKYLSPMVMGLVRFLKETTITKSLKNYVNFVLLNLIHCQTQMEMLSEFVQKYDIPENIKEYTLSWIEKGEIAFLDHKGKIRVFETFSNELLSGNIENALKTIDPNVYPDLPLNLFQACIFYITVLVDKSDSIENVCDNCLKYINYLIKAKLLQQAYVEAVLAHPTLLQHFSLLHLESDACTKFLLNVITLLLDSDFDISLYLEVYREKLLVAILKVIKKPKKYSSLNLIKVLQLFELNYSQCHTVLTTITCLSKNDNYVTILDILSYTLKRLAALYETEVSLESIQGNIIDNLTTYFAALNEQDNNVSRLSEAFQMYFQVFPHHIKHVNGKLLPNLANRNDYAKENVALIVFLLERNIQLFDSIKDNLDNLCNKKGVLLPILDVLVDKNVDESILNQIFQQFEVSLTKALVKPQKAGQHFHNSFKGLTVLVHKFMPLEKCSKFTDKVQKFEVTEVFHIKLLETVFNKVVDDSVTAKQVNNIILTFVYLQMQVFKRSAKSNDNVPDFSKLNDVAETFNNILTKIRLKGAGMDLKSTTQSETMKSYLVYCLKFGISGEPVLLKLITNIIKVLASSMEKEDAKLILDMLLSHSKFLDVVLDEHSLLKLEILRLFLTLCQIWNEFMERCHIPVLLAGYRATVNPCDRVIWMLLKMYAANPGQTSFHDFKPFLWGRAAANHYSVRQDADKSLWRQPKMRDIVDILQEDYVLHSIVSYPLKENLESSLEGVVDIEYGKKTYDLNFFLPLFSHLLAHEQQVQTYAFTRSGALSLTVAALSSEEQNIREAACHVLSRFHFHVDASQHGKDNPLWIRYVEAVCKGIAVLPDKKLNNFSAVYLARMALFLTQPKHVMYVPLSQHLTAKSSLDFSSVPELYTFLHSSDINYKEHRNFILQLLKDGLRTEKDFTDFLRSMAFKLFSELYNSCLSDLETKLMILDVIWASCKIRLGARMLCENNSLLVQLFQAVNNVSMLPSREKKDARFCVSRIMLILLEIGKTLQDSHTLFMIFNSALKVVKDDVFSVLSEADQKMIFEVLYLVCKQSSDLFTEEIVSVLLEKCDDRFCKYVVEYGCDFVDVNCLNPNDKYYYLRLLIVNKMKTRNFH